MVDQSHLFRQSQHRRTAMRTSQRLAWGTRGTLWFLNPSNEKLSSNCCWAANVVYMEGNYCSR